MPLTLERPEHKEAISNWPAPYKNLSKKMIVLRNEFDSLCLQATSSVSPRQAIPPEHFELLSLMANSATTSVKIPSLYQTIVKWFICILGALHDTLTVSSLKLRFVFSLARAKAQKTSVIMKIWSPGPTSIKNQDDFYFGPVHRYLKENGEGSLYLGGDGRSDDGFLGNKVKRILTELELAKAMFSENPIRYIPERIFVPIWAPLRLTIDQLLTSLKLRRFARNTKDKELKILAAYTSSDILRHSTIRNAVYYYIGQSIAKIWKPKAFVTLYEGHTWEKLAWRGAKEAVPDCLVIGYQHTVILRHSPLLLDPVENCKVPFKPDMIICTGKGPQSMMEPSHPEQREKFLSFGSCRRKEGETKLEVPSPKRKTILVVPEGIMSEAVLIYDFVIQLAGLLPDHTFIFRNHPIQPFDQVRPHLKHNPDPYANIFHSKGGPIENDFKKSSVVFYRGSSTIFYAVLHGLKPFYMDDGRHDIDPLFELKGWRERITDLNEVAGQIKRYSSDDSKQNYPDWEKAADYVNNYTQPITRDSVKDFLSRIN